jgi:outer membrane immunogenic protein
MIRISFGIRVLIRGISMKKLTLAAAAISVLLTGTASAADLPARTYNKAPSVVAPVFSWTGCYAGANVGWTQGHMNGEWLANPVGYGGSAPIVNASSRNSLISDSFIGGGQVGCNWQTGTFVLGIEGDIQGLDVNKSVTAVVPNGTFTNEQSFGVNWLSTIRGKAGVTFGNDAWLAYVTGGAAVADVRTRDCEVHAVAPPTCNIALSAYNLVDTRTTQWGYAAAPALNTSSLRTGA